MNIFNKIFNKKKDVVVENTNANINSKLQKYAISHRIKQDIRRWREAVEEAEAPYYKARVKMQQMFKDTVLNGHVKACMNRRKNLTKLQKFDIYNKDGSKNEELTKFFEKNWFSLVVDYILDAKFYAYSMINWTKVQNGELKDIQIVPRDFVNPDLEIISENKYGQTGIDINSSEIKNWSLYVNTTSEHGISKCGYGILYEVALYEILLRNLLGQNADLTEKFGQPLTVVTTSKTNEDEREYLEDMLANLGASGYMIKDPGDEISHLEYDKIDNGWGIFDNLEQRCEAKISKIILGHADALDSTPGKLGSTEGTNSPTQIALSEIQTIDSNFVEYYVNDFLMPKLMSLGIIKSEVYFKYSNNAEEEFKIEKKNEKRKNISEYAKTLYEAGFSIDSNWLSEEMDIPLSNITND